MNQKEIEQLIEMTAQKTIQQIIDTPETIPGNRIIYRVNRNTWK